MRLPEGAEALRTSGEKTGTHHGLFPEREGP